MIEVLLESKKINPNVESAPKDDFESPITALELAHETLSSTKDVDLIKDLTAIIQILDRVTTKKVSLASGPTLFSHDSKPTSSSSTTEITAIDQEAKILNKQASMLFVKLLNSSLTLKDFCARVEKSMLELHPGEKEFPAKDKLVIAEKLIKVTQEIINSKTSDRQKEKYKNFPNRLDNLLKQYREKTLPDSEVEIARLKVSSMSPTASS